MNDERAQEIRKFLSGLLQQMEVQAEVKVYLPEKGRYKVFLEGQGLGAIIGRRGETLDLFLAKGVEGRENLPPL